METGCLMNLIWGCGCGLNNLKIGEFENVKIRSLMRFISIILFTNHTNNFII